jgi:hypothetical protein
MYTLLLKEEGVGEKCRQRKSIITVPIIIGAVIKDCGSKNLREWAVGDMYTNIKIVKL